MAQTIFTLTIFVSAFLLFLVQPLVGKLILPKLGGTPQVWNTCMVFFQSVLLLGYGYTHSVSTRLKLRQQLMFHGALLAIPIIMLLLFPIYATVHTWNPPAGSNPIPQTLLLLFTIVGIPFFVVSTSAPLLQRWFGYSGHLNAKDPYFLYSASNAGSLLSLLFYPAVIEPFTYLQTQSYIWLGGYVFLAVLIAYCAFIIYKVAPPDEQLAVESAPPPAPAEVPEAVQPTPAPAPQVSTAVKSGHAPGGIQRKKGMRVPGKLDDHAPAAPVISIARGATAPMSNWRRIRWVLLAAVPSSLMLGVTSYISTDLSPFPLVWIIPLSLYLLSFIWVYTKWTAKGITVDWTGRKIQLFGPPGYTLHEIILYLGQPLGIMFLCYIVLNRGFDPFVATSFVMIGFFMCALACHGELAEDRPSTQHLTEYFLMMSLGGAIGGIFNGIVAPVAFQGGVYEFYVAIVVACIVRSQYVPSGWFDELLMQAFPGLRNWARNQGTEMSKSLGRPAPEDAQSTYLFNYFLDIVLGAFVLAMAYWLRTKFSETDWISRLLKFMSLDRNWWRFAFNAIVYGVPMVFCFFFAGRPLRFTLGVLGLLLANMYFIDRGEDKVLEARRTYFGLLRVMQDTDVVFPYSPDQYAETVVDPKARDWLKIAPPEKRNYLTLKPSLNKEGQLSPPIYPYHYLMHGTTYHGRNYLWSPDETHYRDASRLATTYYHRYGPVGWVMERDNVLPGPQDSFWTDTRLPTSMIGQIAASLGSLTVPLPALLETWSETPFATIGLGTGTMASYSRPYQHMTYYEIDDVMRGFSLPERDGQLDSQKDGYYTYLQQAIRRGVNMEVVMGDARQSLQPAVLDREGKVIGGEPTNFKNAFSYFGDFKKIDPKLALKQHSYWNAPYGVTQREPTVDGKPNMMPNREKYYRAINVDAFSSDAIPVHLITKQAIEMYMSKLRDDGVLCVHTSNRHMNLVRPVARIAMELKLGCMVGKDEAPRFLYGRRDDWPIYLGHFSSEYVMLYRKESGFEEYVKKLRDEKEQLVEAGKANSLPKGKQLLNSFVEWYDPYADQFFTLRNGQRILLHRKVTTEDSLWTDDYSYILGVLR